jgi:hypothetical protein
MSNTIIPQKTKGRFVEVIWVLPILLRELAYNAMPTFKVIIIIIVPKREMAENVS